MRRFVHQTIQVGLIAFLLFCACTGCASLNKKLATTFGLELKDTPSAETEPPAVTEAKDTPTAETEPLAPAAAKEMPSAEAEPLVPAAAKEMPSAEAEPLVPVEPAPMAPEDTQVAPPNEIEAEPPQKPTYHIHTVKWHGETLAIIAKWYTGNLKNWEALTQVNSNLLPSRIFVGDRVRIPENLLKTREPMPQQFVAGFYPKPKKKLLPPITTPPPLPAEEEKLFGPKHYPKK